MLTNDFYATLASLLRGVTIFPGNLFVAVGAGDAIWDDAVPETTRDVTQLVNEVARQAVNPEEIAYLDTNGEATVVNTPRLRIPATFGPDEAVGTLRECGLFGGDATRDAGSGTLLVYYAYPRLEKTTGMVLERVIRIDLTPLPYAPGSRITRYLGNSSTRELHDLDQVTPQCQTNRIRPDNRFYHAGVAAAREMGYDFCAYCFGPDMSER
jgi:hypothetical protein